MLFQSADLIAILIETSLVVGMGFIAAESVLVHDAVLSMDMLIHPTAQLPVSMAKGAMGVVFVLGKRTGQGFGIHRLLYRGEAGVRVLVLQNLFLAAGQSPVFVIAVCGMLMEDLLPSAGQHRLGRLHLHRLIRQAADKGLSPPVAFIGMLVGRLLRHAAAGFLGNGIARVIMTVAGGFLQRADKLAVFIIAAFSMAVPVALLLTAGQVSGLRIAFLRVQVQISSPRSRA